MATNARFLDQATGEYVDTGKEATFLNEYFINIVNNLSIPPSDMSMTEIYDVDAMFCFHDDMPTIPEVTKLIVEIDVNKSSCVENISTKFCKAAMLAVPDLICQMMIKSLIHGQVPSDWTRGMITVLPKDGDLKKYRELETNNPNFCVCKGVRKTGTFENLKVFHEKDYTV